MAAPADRNPHEVVEAWRQVLRMSRHVTGPPFVALLLGAASWAAHQWTYVGYAFGAVWLWAVWVGLCSLESIPQRSAVPRPAAGAPWWQRAYLWTRRNVERLYAVAAYLAAATWSTLVVTWEGLTVPMIGAGGVLLAPLWAAWFWHRRVRLSVAIEHDVAAWGDGSRVGLMGTTARAVAAGADWFRIRVKPKRGEGGQLHTHDEYRNSRARIAALFGVRLRDVTMKESKDEAVVEYVIRTKEREVVKQPLSLEMDRIAGLKRLGTTDDGEVVHTAYYLTGKEGIGAGGQHGVSVGKTGSGKSSEANMDCAASARAVDDILIVWDFSYGAAELRAWAPCAGLFCHTVDQAKASLLWARDLCRHRGANMKGRHHKVSKRAPGITFVIDEGASAFAPQLLDEDRRTGDLLIDQALANAQVNELVELWTECMRLFRKYGIKVRLKTQYGVDAALGGETAKQQLTTFRSVFLCARDQDAAQIVPLSLARTSEFPANKPGTCHHIGPTVADGGSRLRVDYLDDLDIRRMVEAWKDHQPQPEAPLNEHPLWVNGNRTPPPRADDGDDLDDDDEETPALEGRQDLEDEEEAPAALLPAAPEREPEPDPGAPEPEPEPARRRMLATEDTLHAVWGTLVTQPKLSSGELASVLGYSSRWVGKLLGELVRQGKAERVGQGRATKYRAVPREQWPRQLVETGSAK